MSYVFPAWLTDLDFVRALRFLLGIPICAETTGAQCGALADSYSDHALSGAKTRRHYDLLALKGTPVLSEQILKP